MTFITQAHLKTPSPPALLYPIQVYPFSVVLIGPGSHSQFCDGNLKMYFPSPLLPQECYLRNSLNAGKCYTNTGADNNTKSFATLQKEQLHP